MLKKHLSFRQMVNLNFGFLGIQFGWALQMANMSGIYKFLGADVSSIGYLWIAAPLSGMLIQPILGHLSDHTWIRGLGRRRPYILFGAVLSTLALILMPNSPSIWFAAVLLWILDGSINIAMQPYRALVADVAPEKQVTKCYSVQTALVGIGATLASALPWFLINVVHLQSNPLDTNAVPLTLRLSFYIGAAVFILANLWTVFFSKEYPYQKTSMENQEKVRLKDLLHIPKIMREVAYVQFFSWSGMFCLFLYFGLGVAQNIFGLPAGAAVEANPIYHKMLENGIAVGGMCFGIYTFISIIYAMLIPIISKKITRRGTHILSLSLGALALIAANHVHSEMGLYITMIGLGCAWASIVTTPYAILASSLPERQMGLYMGLLNITICVPEIIAALALGIIVKVFFHDSAMQIVQVGGILMFIGALFTFFVSDKKS